MSLKKDIIKVMNEGYNSRLNNLADLIDQPEDDVAVRIKKLDFKDYVDLMRTLRDFDKEAAKQILGYVEEAYSQGGTMSPSEMRSQKSTPAQKAQTTAAMQRMGSKRPGVAANALDKASQGKTLSSAERGELAGNAEKFQKLATDPSTRTQMRNLLNKLK